MRVDQVNRWKKVFDRTFLVIGLVVLAALVAYAIWIIATLDRLGTVLSWYH